MQMCSNLRMPPRRQHCIEINFKLFKFWDERVATIDVGAGIGTKIRVACPQHPGNEGNATYKSVRYSGTQIAV